MKKITKGPAIESGIIFFLALGFILGLVIKYFFSGLGIEYCMAFGYVVWGFFYFFWLFKYFWIIPAPNTAQIIQNKWIKDKGKEMVTVVNEVEIPQGQYPVFTGWNAIWPWHEPYEKPIALIINEPCPVQIVAQDRNSVNFTFNLGLLLAPVRDHYLPLYWKVSEKAALDFFQKKLERLIATAFANEDGDEVIKTSEKFLVPIIEKAFGPTVDLDERKYARSVSGVTVGVITKEQDAQNIAQLVKGADQIAKAIKKINEATPGDPQARTLALAALSGQKINISTIKLDTK